MIEFFVGDRVLAPAFGAGTVALVDGFVPYQTLTVDFDGAGRRVVNPKQVALELVERGEEGSAADAAEQARAATRPASSTPTRSGGAADRPARRFEPDPPGSVAAELRRVIREELGLSDTPLADRWAGGEMVLRPGKPGLREKSVPLETFFRKIVAVRDRLRVLEQKVNTSGAIPDAERLELQGYITKCYGTLTTFNTLFADRDDWFVGEKGEKGEE